MNINFHAHSVKTLGRNYHKQRDEQRGATRLDIQKYKENHCMSDEFDSFQG